MRYLFALLFIVLHYTLLSQVSIEPRLESAMNENRDWIPVLLSFHEQAKIDSLQLAFNAIQTPVADRPKAVIETTQKVAQRSQREMLQFLDENSIAYRQGPQIFIVNMLALHLKAEGIDELRHHPNLRGMLLDESPFSLIEPVRAPESTPRAQNSSEPGLTVVGAPALWAMGYTGRGTTMLSVDTGVWPDHPALKKQWKGHRVPLSESWFGYDLEFPGDKSGSHGTHTSGTVLGLDSAMNDTIGLAFNAYFIATDPVANSQSQVKPLSAYLLAYQWSLNPDGDINTSDDVPHAINNSWGRSASEESPYCDEDMTQMFLAVEAAGIANVSSAGNSGPEPMTMSVPHNINSNEVNIFTVGSVNGHSPSLPISDFSSRGPSQCAGEGSILIKPEVVAPGQNVRSAVGQNEYASLSGTSMACPHVVGSVLLLKEAFPYLPGKDILEALYYSAIDLGAPGEDNTYGMGIINLMDAFEYLTGMGYVPEPPFIADHDLVLQEVVWPSVNATCESSIEPIIRVRNFGSQPINGFEVHYGIPGEAEQSFEYTETLAPNAWVDVTLPTYNTVSVGYTEMLFSVEPNEDLIEQDVLNNQLFARFAIKTSVEIDFVETFETENIDLSNWHIENPDNEMTWEPFTLPETLDSAVCMRVELAEYSPRASQLDDFVGPKVAVPSGGQGLFLAFDLAYQLRNTPPFTHDTLRVYIASECNEAEPVLVYKKGGEALSTWDVNTPYFVPTMEEQWRREVIDLSDVANGEYVIPIFQTENRRGNNLYINNIAVYTDSDPLSVAEEWLSDLVLFPNPARNEATLRWGSVEQLLNVTLLEGTGRALTQWQVHGNTGETNINLNGLSRGLYFVRVSGQTGNRVMKLVKH